MVDQRVHDDPGLQPERTSLAWTRTTLAMLVCSLALVRWYSDFPAVMMIVAAVLGLAAVLILLRSRSRYRHGARGIAHEKIQPNVVEVVLLTIGVTVFATTELVMMVTYLIHN